MLRDPRVAFQVDPASIGWILPIRGEIRIACEVQPDAGPAFAVAGGLQERVNEVLPGFGAVIGGKRGLLFW